MSIFPMKLSDKDTTDPKIAGLSLRTLAKEYGTPLYVMDVDTIRNHIQNYTKALATHYPNSQVFYAGKANLTQGLIEVIHQEGLGLDVVSGGELYTALQTKLNPENILFHGNNKSLPELKLGLEHGVTFVLDNHQEFHNISQLLKENKGYHAKFLVRMKPGIEAHTHDYIKTGQIDSKFGVDAGDLISIIESIHQHPHMTYVGLHSHIGSQIFDMDPYQLLVERMLEPVKELADKNISTSVVNIGGGIGVKYTTDDQPFQVGSFIEKTTQHLKSECKKQALPEPKLYLEPGRSIIGTAGITLYNIGTIKKIENSKTYLFIDGGMADNPRPMMYQAEYTFDILSDSPTGQRKEYAIAGKFCESGDVFTHKVELPEAKIGDILIVYGTGAYNYVMASNYNRVCRPGMVALENGKVKTWVQRETYEDIVRFDKV